VRIIHKRPPVEGGYPHSLRITFKDCVDNVRDKESGNDALTLLRAMALQELCGADSKTWCATAGKASLDALPKGDDFNAQREWARKVLVHEVHCCLRTAAPAVRLQMKKIKDDETCERQWELNLLTWCGDCCHKLAMYADGVQILAWRLQIAWPRCIVRRERVQRRSRCTPGLGIVHPSIPLRIELLLVCFGGKVDRRKGCSVTEVSCTRAAYPGYSACHAAMSDRVVKSTN
jgi:hypothetical protein